MTVTELLKGKKAYEKDELLDDENLAIYQKLLAE